MDWSAYFPKVTEIKNRYFFGAWLFGTLLIFLPSDIKQKMAVSIPDGVRPWVGFATLAAFVLWLVLGLLHVLSFIQNKIKERETRKNILSHLDTLSQGEREVFIFCIANNQRTIYRNINDSSVNSLKSKRLVVMAPQGSVLSMPNTIPKFVWDHVTENAKQLFPEAFNKKALKALEEKQKNGWMNW